MRPTGLDLIDGNGSASATLGQVTKLIGRMRRARTIGGKGSTSGKALGKGEPSMCVFVNRCERNNTSSRVTTCGGVQLTAAESRRHTRMHTMARSHW